jgi:hypothetical protein
VKASEVNYRRFQKYPDEICPLLEDKF